MQTYLPQLTEPARRWLRFVGLLAALTLLACVAYRLRTVFTPLLASAALAYVLNPLVTWFERRRGVARLTTVCVTFALLMAALLGGGLYVGSRTLAQLADLQQRLPGYMQTINQWIVAAGVQPSSTDSEPADLPAGEQQWWQWSSGLLAEHGVGLARSTLEYVGNAAANIFNLLSVLVLIPLFTFYFLWRFNDLVAAVRAHLPAAYRQSIVTAAVTIDAAVSSFFRGRLIVCLVVGLLIGIGWSLVGVPYSLPLGALAGLLNLVPFLSLAALPPALLFTYLNAHSMGQDWVVPLVLTFGVYMLVQGVESFVLSPTIEGRSAGLHPLLIVVALLIGAELAGMIGLLLAIPVASILCTYARRLILPEIRRVAGLPVDQAVAGTAGSETPPAAPPD